jgi:anti-sigma regulatory factor (Ser/Thr protein kinase)
MRTTMPATLEAVDQFFVELGSRSHAMLEQHNSFPAELLLREALTNAVVHGCGSDPGKQVRCFLRLRASRLLIAVADDGDGFDWHATRGNRADVPDSSGRGMEILNIYASHVRFNKKGNVVTMITQLQGGKHA